MADRVAAVQAPGGCGALRILSELLVRCNDKAKVWVSDPTWANHIPLIGSAGLKIETYPYFDKASASIRFDAMMDTLRNVNKGDIVLLHGCCHNPTGANLNSSEWDAVIEVLQSTGAVPMIDIAYQGFGDGLEADAAATRKVASSVPECLIAASCSKNFGIYRERTGILMLVASEAAQGLNQATLAFLNRQNYSFPPDHGARIVSTILTDDALKADWQAELEEVRNAMLALREQLAGELQRLSGSDRFGFLAQHRGMFSRLGTTPDKVEALREKHGIYMVGDSRMNIAGLNQNSVPILARAIIDVGI